MAEEDNDGEDAIVVDMDIAVAVVARCSDSELEEWLPTLLLPARWLPAAEDETFVNV